MILLDIGNDDFLDIGSNDFLILDTTFLVTLGDRDLTLTLQSNRVFNLTLLPRDLTLTLPDR